MMPYELLKEFVPVSNCLKKRDNGDFLIVLNEDGELFYLNDTAKFIYLSFDSKKNVEDIFKLMKTKFEANSEDDEIIIKKDLIEIIRDFQWQKIVNLMEV